MRDAVIREAVEADFPAITTIYAENVANGCGTFELEAPELAEMKARFAYVAALGLPRLVAESDGTILGYAYAGPFRAREAYRYMVEDSIYLAANARGMGIGGRLLDALIDSCTKIGLRQMVAVIGDSENEGSIALHRSRGFADSGIFHAAGWKHDGWRDVIFMQKPLNSGGDTPPNTAGLAIKDTH